MTYSAQETTKLFNEQPQMDEAGKKTPTTEYGQYSKSDMALVASLVNAPSSKTTGVAPQETIHENSWTEIESFCLITNNYDPRRFKRVTTRFNPVKEDKPKKFVEKN
jgi:hypothetical protein